MKNATLYEVGLGELIDGLPVGFSIVNTLNSRYLIRDHKSGILAWASGGVGCVHMLSNFRDIECLMVNLSKALNDNGVVVWYMMGDAPNQMVFNE